jgi:hypothetical protein
LRQRWRALPLGLLLQKTDGAGLTVRQLGAGAKEPFFVCVHGKARRLEEPAHGLLQERVFLHVGGLLKHGYFFGLVVAGRSVALF